MARLVMKNGYLKGGHGKPSVHLDYLVKYVATRAGVEIPHLRNSDWCATKKQQALIGQLLKDFPNTKESFEYQDYLAQPSRGNASDLITTALEQNLDQLTKRENYVDYIANRPHVETFGTHGLFTGDDTPLELEQVAKEVSAHHGNVWIPIISLRREDAQRVGFDNAAAWKALLCSKAPEIADSLKIHPDHLKWYAAYHNESHHPHVHMICYSTSPREGYLTRQGIDKMKSTLAREIFRENLTPIYIAKGERRENLSKQSALAMKNLVEQMQSGTLQNERIEQLITHLAEQLRRTTGKQQYGYLRPEAKRVVDGIVDEIARDERVAEAYRQWWTAKTQVDSTYTDTPAEPPPLSQCADFKPIRNMVIREALSIQKQVGTFDEPAGDLSGVPPDALIPEAIPELPDTGTEYGDPPDLPPPFPPVKTCKDAKQSWWSVEYKAALQFLFGNSNAGIAQDFQKARAMLTDEAAKDNPLAMHDLGRMAADGLGCDPDQTAAHGWHAKALASFHNAEAKKPWKYTEYRIGKLYAAGLGTEQDYVEAAKWLSLAAAEKYKYAEYTLAGLYYQGKGVEENRRAAFELYTRSSEQGFPYASYELGKMLRDGVGCVKNNATAQQAFQSAFHDFSTLEQTNHDDKLQYRLGWMLLNGVGTNKDVTRARFHLEKAAAVGNAFACYQLAKLVFSDKYPLVQDVAQAVAWLRKAVAAENSYAQYLLGKLLQEGKHVPKDISAAIRLWMLSAKQGNEFAAYRLGKLYLGGDGVRKDVDAALHWLAIAAEQKNQFAQYALGVLYWKGEDVVRDLSKGYALLTRAAKQGNQFAQYRLGNIYLTGENVRKEVDTALHFLYAAANQGNQYAQYTLGKLYLMGKDAPRDIDAATQWFTRAAAQGNLYAQFFLDHMDQSKEPSVFFAATRLLYCLSQLFDETQTSQPLTGLRIDRKRQRKLREKKIAAGHAEDDHEEVISL